MFFIDLGCFLHHESKFLKINLTVSIGINFFHSSFNCVHGAEVFNIGALEKFEDFLIIDGATSVLVEHVECCSQVFIL